MGRRLQLQEILEQVLGSRNVYFQPPNNLTMQYPAIVYHYDNEWAIHGSNKRYAHKDRYKVTHIDRNPDSPIKEQILNLPLSSLGPRFVQDNLNHTVFTIYY